MFDMLIASAPPRRRATGAGPAGLLSVVGHAALVAAAVYATLPAAPAPAADPVTDARVVYVDPAPPLRAPESPGPPSPADDLGPLAALHVPTIGVPPIATSDLRGPWRPTPGPGVADLRRSGGTPSGDIYAGAVVDEMPVLLSGPPLAYPELLRRARIAGRVMVEAVIDTSGHAEPATIRVVHAVHPAFADAVREYVRGALFRPGRVHGRAVRVLVRLPVEFALR